MDGMSCQNVDAFVQIISDILKETLQTMQNRTELKSYELAPGGDNIYKKEIDAFTDAIVNDKPVVIKPEEALLVQRACEAAYESSETGKRIDLK